jgi:hypothetical protein
MDNLHVSTEQRIAASHAADAIHHIDAPDLSGTIAHSHSAESVTSSEQDDLDLQKLGYKSVLARGWGSFDNFACSFSALYCIGGIRVLFYIALSNGGPAAMYVIIINYSLISQILTLRAIVGVHGFPAVSSQLSLQRLWPRHVLLTPQLGLYITGPSGPGVVGNWVDLSLSWSLLGPW